MLPTAHNGSALEPFGALSRGRRRGLLDVAVGVADLLPGDVRLDKMATDGHLMVMKSVGVAELKGNLSKHLRAVRRGHPLTVLDRDTPVAQLIPYPEGEAALPVRRPAEGAGRLNQLRWPPPLKLRHDPVSLLLEDRLGR